VILTGKGFYPFIDYSTGGSIGGMIKAAEANLAAVTDRTIVIPGHGSPVSNKQELSAYRDVKRRSSGPKCPSMPPGSGAVTISPSGVCQRSQWKLVTCGRSTRSCTTKLV